jgi:hypothetical protein
MDGDPMIDDEVAAHTRVTVLAYWKFESVSLPRGVCELSVPEQAPVKRLACCKTLRAVSSPFGCEARYGYALLKIKRDIEVSIG